MVNVHCLMIPSQNKRKSRSGVTANRGWAGCSRKLIVVVVVDHNDGLDAMRTIINVVLQLFS